MQTNATIVVVLMKLNDNFMLSFLTSFAARNVFINVFILELRKLNCGCHVNGVFVGCLLYADDIILLSQAVRGLQMMLDKWYETVGYVSLSFNVSKCRRLALGKMYNAVMSPLRIGNLHIEWSNCIIYLGVYVVNSKHVKFDINPVCGLQLHVFSQPCTSEMAIPKCCHMLLQHWLCSTSKWVN